MPARLIAMLAAMLCALPSVLAQEPEVTDGNERDSLYIAEVENAPGRPKLLHAEPLFIDLIRDLGARKGEREWNLGFGLTDNLGYDAYEMLVEYEFAPIDRLGFEVEVPVTLYAPQRNGKENGRPADRVESLKLATQWTFLVAERAKTSLALGYIHEFILPDIGSRSERAIIGNLFNPFFVAAKRWGDNFHTLVYTGPHMLLEHGATEPHMRFEVNSNLHYMISGTRNFVGVEFNKSIDAGDFDMTIRPQMRVGIAENFLVGIVTGIPVERENQRFSSFMRLIWEPGHRKAKH
ncbi:MAG TPA: HAEPLYID family protein [Flavobacteriales bacterium]|nr:HAEPLYID family protein [Flavobacteriales bacterium]